MWVVIFLLGIAAYAFVLRTPTPGSPVGLAILVVSAVAVIGIVAWATRKWL
jgi:hypothetical protein